MRDIKDNVLGGMRVPRVFYTSSHHLLTDRRHIDRSFFVFCLSLLAQLLSALVAVALSSSTSSCLCSGERIGFSSTIECSSRSASYSLKGSMGCYS